MKRVLSIALLLIVVFACKNESKSKDAKIIEAVIAKEQSENLTVLKGSFVYYDGAAVLQTSNEIYGVLVTEKMEELNKQAEMFKTEPTDMVQVEVKGTITNQKDDKILWKNKVNIVEIINVRAIPKEENNVVKLGKE
ncbi:hypothetical protein [Algibacter mikhailovii]|uniref:NlpE C-terminal OB domain-containing protein n=1 Tax=Algibacter mikhailovii TaxID=425498 RepID=A0A918R617_9FLAO|nr:hypothetical protein [Algibacter mikhailovii]GGZ84854.1 hypothetical protein GCM10007028_23610 [Algibacter mikhailovii]